MKNKEGHNMHALRVMHKALGELIEKGLTVINNEDHAGEFEEIVMQIACCERSSGGHRFTLTKEEWDGLNK